MKKKKYLIISCVIAVLVMCAGIGSAWAYFTTHTKALGDLQLTLGDHTYLHEDEPEDWTKKIRVGNNKEGDYDAVDPVYARVQAIAGSLYYLEMVTAEGKSPGWVDGGDGWFYYTELIQPTKESETLEIKIREIISGEAVEISNENHKPGDEVNVAIVYETVAVQYDDAGNALPYDQVNWDPAASEDLSAEGE